MKRWAVTRAAWVALTTISCMPAPAPVAAGEPDAAATAIPRRIAPPAELSGLPDPGATSAAAVDAGTPVPDASLVPDVSELVAREPDVAPPPTTTDAAAVTTAADAAPPAEPAADTRAPLILRVRDITADRVIAGTIYAHRLDAKTGTAGAKGTPLSDMALAQELGPDNLKVTEVVADVLYAHDVHAGRIELQETHAAMVTIEKPDP
jgi:hypothetical protein